MYYYKLLLIGNDKKMNPRINPCNNAIDKTFWSNMCKKLLRDCSH